MLSPQVERPEVEEIIRTRSMRPTVVSHILCVLVLLIPLFEGCEILPQQPLPQQPLPEITSESEEGFCDLVFAIQEHQKLPDGSQTIRASGTYKGKLVGWEIFLGPNWHSGSLGTDIPLTTYQGEVIFRSKGTESDLLLQSLDQLYGTKQLPKAMNQATNFTAISLEGDPRDLTKGPVKIKLFFESNDED